VVQEDLDYQGYLSYQKALVVQDFLSVLLVLGIPSHQDHPSDLAVLDFHLFLVIQDFPSFHQFLAIHETQVHLFLLVNQDYRGGH